MHVGIAAFVLLGVSAHLLSVVAPTTACDNGAATVTPPSAPPGYEYVYLGEGVHAGDFQQSFAAEAGGDFVGVLFVHVAGSGPGVTCDYRVSASGEYVWQNCQDGHGGCRDSAKPCVSLEFLVGNQLVLEQPSWGQPPAECTIPVPLATGSVFCNVSFSTELGEPLTTTWREPRLQVSLHDNRGMHLVRVYGLRALPSPPSPPPTNSACLGIDEMRPRALCLVGELFSQLHAAGEILNSFSRASKRPANIGAVCLADAKNAHAAATDLMQVSYSVQISPTNLRGPSSGLGPIHADEASLRSLVHGCLDLSTHLMQPFLLDLCQQVLDALDSC